jgi:hypothetical protein
VSSLLPKTGILSNPHCTQLACFEQFAMVFQWECYGHARCRRIKGEQLTGWDAGMGNPMGTEGETKG